jgi:hypothetical protein
MGYFFGGTVGGEAFWETDAKRFDYGSVLFESVPQKKELFSAITEILPSNLCLRLMPLYSYLCALLFGCVQDME